MQHLQSMRVPCCLLSPASLAAARTATVFVPGLNLVAFATEPRESFDCSNGCSPRSGFKFSRVCY